MGLARLSPSRDPDAAGNSGVVFRSGVSAMTKDDIILMADASGLSWYGMGKDMDKFLHYLEAFANLIAKREREECAKVCEDASGTGKIISCTSAAAAIRARGNT